MWLDFVCCLLNLWRWLCSVCSLFCQLIGVLFDFGGDNFSFGFHLKICMEYQYSCIHFNQLNEVWDNLYLFEQL